MNIEIQKSNTDSLQGYMRQLYIASQFNFVCGKCQKLI